MNIKKWLFTLCAAGMLITLAAQSSEAQTAGLETQESVVAKTEKIDYSFLNGKTGVIITQEFSEENLKDLINKYRDCKIEKLIFGDSITGCLAMLKSDRAGFMAASDFTANYIVARNPELKSVITADEIGFAMVLRNSDTGLRDSINSAIAKLKASGKTDELYNKWVKELPAGQEPAMVKIEKTSDTETVYVGVAGDAPPLDYMGADGKPAGYNIALLAEISKLIGKNIEVVSLDSQARYAALESKKIDVFFWMILPYAPKILENIKADAEEEAFRKKFIVTEPYCMGKYSFLLKK